MITPKDTIGYICKNYVDGKEQFEYIEAKIKSVRIGKRGTKVYTDKFYVLDAEDIEHNTEWMNETAPQLILVQEPFITNPEIAERCRKNVDYWNEHGARSIWDDLVGKENEDA